MSSQLTNRFGFQSRPVRSTRYLLAVLLAVCTFLSGCASESQNLSLAQHAVDLFHSQLDSERYSAIYQAADARLKETTSEPSFVKLLQGVHQTLGAVQNSTQKRTIFQLAQGTMRLDYDTDFARGA